jgi:arylsulfatase A-like enzyme
MQRRQFLKSLGMGAAAVAAPSLLSAIGEANAARRPNLLFLFTDDQRFNTLNALGNEAIETPNIDKLVKRGTAFTNCYIQGSTTGAVCICSRAQLIQGRSVFRSPFKPPAEGGPALWPETFRKAGYRTFGTGKWHNGTAAYARSFTDGAAIFFGGMSRHNKVPIHEFSPDGKYPREDRTIARTFSSELFSDAAVDFLKTYDGEDPFFAYVSYTAPHDPRMAPKEFVDKYPPDKIDLPPNYMPEHPFDNGQLRIRDERLAGFPRKPDEVKKHIGAYYAMITHLDHHIGRVLKALDESGHADDTLVVFASDNGLGVGQHGLMGKQNLYEHSVRVPLVFAGPGIPAGRRHDGLVYLHDLFPTTCEMASIPVPGTVESKSLAPLVKGGEAVRASIFAAYTTVQRMVRTPDWKLIRYHVKGEETVQLFHIAKDPWELNNLAEEADQARRVAQMTALMSEWMKKTGDRFDFEKENWGKRKRW